MPIDILPQLDPDGMHDSQGWLYTTWQDSLIRFRYDENDELWFIATDVCVALELSNVSRAVSRLDADEKGITSSDTLGGSQEMLMINESGLYTLVLSSRKPGAKTLKRWITHDLLPQLRKRGFYISAGITPEQVIGLKAAYLELYDKNDTLMLENADQHVEIVELRRKVDEVSESEKRWDSLDYEYREEED